MKKETEATKGNTVAGLEANYIEETLKFVESNEMKEHLRKWFASGGVRRPFDTCAEIVYKAPVAIEQKLPTLKLLAKHDKSKDTSSREYVDAMQKYLDARYNETEGMVYDLDLYTECDCYNEERIKFKSFDEAIEHIKSLEKQANSINMDETETRKSLQNSDLLALDEAAQRQKIKGYKNGLVFALEKYPKEAYDELHVTWYLNKVGEILYTDFCFGEIPGRLNLPTRFAAGDLVIADCQPFGGEQKVLILENEDIFKSVDGSGVTCIFINEHGNIDAGYFKSNEFLPNPDRTYVSALYRARTFTGGLSEGETPLGVIREALAKRPKLGREMFMCLNNLKMYAIGEYSNTNENSISKLKSYGIGWEVFKKRFGL